MNAVVKPDGATSAVFGKPDERELRDRMKKDLPADTFKPQTWRVFWFLPLQLLICGGVAVIRSIPRKGTKPKRGEAPKSEVRAEISPRTQAPC